MRLLTDGGLLAGFTLQQVGDEAGVAKALVYHYFQNRQALMRSALRHGAIELQTTFRAIPYSVYRRRLSVLAKATLTYPAAVQLMTLLLIDRDPRLRTMPLLEQTMSDFQRDVREATLPADTDIEALFGVQNSLLYGYVLFRDGLARQMDTDTTTLDTRFLRLVGGIGGRAAALEWSTPPAEIPACPPSRRSSPDPSTAGLLEQAAVDLIDEEGILAGLNLRKVAERAGVHRGLVYHHFGSRRELLLAALRSRLAESGDPTSNGGVPGDLLFSAGINDGEPARLMALLALDGDDSYQPFGRVSPRFRPTNRHMAGVALALGHTIYRRSFAGELGVEIDAWDRRVFAAWARLAPP
ncbi:TetR family transcriptional regulator [Acidiferrimicrobium sp. IK]|uniref:TetR/AcrR family transcriptional regulator n=1 Tax=Acidiferrimicrobium sp. IK TaxID=2871700 RepID=UPI0021CB5D1A|nr:TetR family transcriptional regulator [Acidiferrimicrobium sp. IK]MCU4185249.1 TetR family transcriptional regulator [Acidiferrimicrobium sp. IK]